MSRQHAQYMLLFLVLAVNSDGFQILTELHALTSLVPRPPPSFLSLVVRKSGRGPGTFPHVSDVTDRANYVAWATCKPQKTSPVRMHWSTTIPSRKMAAHEGAFMSLFTRQSGGQRVLPSQDSEDTQQQFSRTRPRSIKAFLPPFYP